MLNSLQGKMAQETYGLVSLSEGFIGHLAQGVKLFEQSHMLYLGIHVTSKKEKQKRLAVASNQKSSLAITQMSQFVKSLRREQQEVQEVAWRHREVKTFNQGDVLERLEQAADTPYKAAQASG